MFVSVAIYASNSFDKADDQALYAIMPYVQGNLGKKGIHVLPIYVQGLLKIWIKPSIFDWSFDWYKSLKKTKIIVIFFLFLTCMAWSTYRKVYINPMHLHIFCEFYRFFLDHWIYVLQIVGYLLPLDRLFDFNSCFPFTICIYVCNVPRT